MSTPQTDLAGLGCLQQGGDWVTLPLLLLLLKVLGSPTGFSSRDVWARFIVRRWPANPTTRSRKLVPDPASTKLCRLDTSKAGSPHGPTPLYRIHGRRTSTYRLICCLVVEAPNRPRVVSETLLAMVPLGPVGVLVLRLGCRGPGYALYTTSTRVLTSVTGILRQHQVTRPVSVGGGLPVSS